MTKKKDRSLDLLSILAFLAPGTPMREALDSILAAGTGALIVMGCGSRVQAIMEGGFKLDVDLTPARLYELAKMDGAIILNNECDRILYANIQLNPDPAIDSQETGIRHRIAERVAKQTNEVIVSISQRRNIITVFYGSQRYSLRDVVAISNKGNQALQTLEKYNQAMRQILVSLSVLELEDLVSFKDVFKVLRRVEMVLRVTRLIECYIVELGSEGRLLEMQLDELRNNMEDEAIFLIRDYVSASDVDPWEVMAALQHDDTDHLSDDQHLAKLLGYEDGDIADMSASARGYRILDKIPRLPQSVMENVIERFGSLQAVLQADEDMLDDVDGVGDIRARSIRQGLARLREQILIDRQL